MKRLLIYITIIPVLFISFSSSYSFIDIKEWGISTGQVKQVYLTNDSKIKQFSVNDHPEYENKIMNYIIAIDSSLKEKINIIRSSQMPAKDFLFVNNKLYSILENHEIISKSSLNGIVKKLTLTFGKPSIQRDKNMTIYSFKSSKTKVLLLSLRKSDNVECKIYYYASNLFRMLISE